MKIFKHEMQIEVRYSIQFFTSLDIMNIRYELHKHNKIFQTKYAKAVLLNFLG